MSHTADVTPFTDVAAFSIFVLHMPQLPCTLRVVCLSDFEAACVVCAGLTLL